MATRTVMNRKLQRLKYLILDSFSAAIAWVLFFSYSRIYLGVHYPLDTIFGLTFGLLSGYLFTCIYNHFKSQKLFFD